MASWELSKDLSPKPPKTKGYWSPGLARPATLNSKHARSMKQQKRGFRRGRVYYYLLKNPPQKKKIGIMIYPKP